MNGGPCPPDLRLSTALHPTLRDPHVTLLREPRTDTKDERTRAKGHPWGKGNPKGDVPPAQTRTVGARKPEKGFQREKNDFQNKNKRK